MERSYNSIPLVDATTDPGHTPGMRRLVSVGLGLAILLGLLLTPGALGLTVLRMGLGELCSNGHRIFRGTVLSSAEGTIQLGGALVPVTTYRIRVDESFKGVAVSPKGERVVELRTLGKSAPVEANGLRRAQLPFEVPQLELGATYVLFTTRPAGLGLATTVGLGQGCFRVAGAEGKETATNELENAGLLVGTSLERAVAPGPLPYDVLARAIRDTLAAQASGP